MTVPTETRADLRERIVVAATHLLREHGPAGVTTRGVAERAGVQAPAIYRVFGDKDGLLDAVAEHVMATYVAAKSDAVEAARAAAVDPVEELRAGWRTYIEFGLANPALYALLSDPQRARRSPATRSGQDVLAARIGRIARAGRLAVGEQRAVDLVHAAGTGAVLTLLSVPAERRDPALADQLFDAVLARIVTDPPPTGQPDVAAAVSLRAATRELTVLSAAEQELLIEWLDRVIDPG